MSDSWVAAAERYAARNESFGLKPEQVRPWLETVRTLVAFVRSDEGSKAQALLAASDKFVILAMTEHAEPSRLVSVLVGRSGKGAVREETPPRAKHKMAVGWGPLGPSKVTQDPLGLGIPLPPMPMYPFEFSKIILQEGKSVEDVLDYLRSELDKIAAQAPAPLELQ